MSKIVFTIQDKDGGINFVSEPSAETIKNIVKNREGTNAHGLALWIFNRVIEDYQAQAKALQRPKIWLPGEKN